MAAYVVDNTTSSRRNYTTPVTELPTKPFCDFCRHPSNGCEIVPATHHTKTKFGPWAHVCEAHLLQYGSGTEEKKAAQPDVPAQRAEGLGPERVWVSSLANKGGTPPG